MSHWVDIQKNAFTRWVNEHLKDRGLHVENIGKEFADGLKLINLLEIISNKKLGRHNRNPLVRPQKLENNTIALAFLKTENIKLVNIGSEDITDGNLKLILGLIWTLILRYQITKGGSDGSAKSDLLRWVQSKIPEYNIQNFQKDWNDGKAINALINALEPGLAPDHSSMNPNDKLANATKGIDRGYDALGVPKIVQADEMIHPKVDELAMMTYISYYRDLDNDPNRKKADEASRSRAWGPGLVEGVAGETAPFHVETPAKATGKLEIKVEGPKSNAPVKVTNLGNGKYDVSYEPKEPGEYRVHVTLGGIHIPGSIFHVIVAEQQSLGGEGKIRIFYSTTSAKDEKTRPLQELLERKKVHERPDFEPWIPVDLMEKEEREAVFKRAGVRELPIVFIDDVYTGNAAKVFELEKSGQLDKILKVNEQKYKSMFGK
ncbi:filamin-C-like [Planoprotostelium fungivorum]|uniref:Filamin-C-like n=1 Tax=Planoprotostelium fungivorum TaxID=1890364 RepID=A0A2P6NX37_9EUKA|nr:filamin-C-like [Planoprotostelium fungivorum]